jgi:hypothetical protein
MSILNILTGKRHYYQIEIKYLSPEKKHIFSYPVQIDMIQKGSILNRRAVLKACHEAIYNQENRAMLCNGTCSLAILCYIGKFKQPQRKINEAEIEDFISKFHWYLAVLPRMLEEMRK